MRGPPGASMRLKSNFVSAGLTFLLALTGVAAAQTSPQGGATENGSAPALEQEQIRPQGNDPDVNRTEETQGIRVLSNLVETPVTVTDSKGEFVYDLSESDFRIFDNGVPQRIENFAQETRSLALVILIQTSESVMPLLPELQPLAPLFSNLLLGQQGQAAVLTYDERVRVAQEFSSSGDQLAETLKNLRAEGDQARLNDALARAIALLGRRPKSERRILLVFSDGFDSGSDTGEEDLVQRATSAEVTIYGMGFSRTKGLLKSKPHSSAPRSMDSQMARPVGPGGAPTPTRSENTYGTPGAGIPALGAAGALIHSAAGSSEMERYAKYTGGVFYSHWLKKTLQDHLSVIASEIHAQYELAYVPTSVRQPGFHHIEVRVMRPGVKVRTREGYFYTSGK